MFIYNTMYQGVNSHFSKLPQLFIPHFVNRWYRLQMQLAIRKIDYLFPLLVELKNGYPTSIDLAVILISLWEIDFWEGSDFKLEAFLKGIFDYSFKPYH